MLCHTITKKHFRPFFAQLFSFFYTNITHFPHYSPKKIVLSISPILAEKNNFFEIISYFAFLCIFLIYGPRYGAQRLAWPNFASEIKSLIFCISIENLLEISKHLVASPIELSSGIYSIWQFQNDEKSRSYDILDAMELDWRWSCWRWNVVHDVF